MTIGLQWFNDPHGLYRLSKREQLEVLGYYASETKPAAHKGRSWTRDRTEATDEARTRHDSFRVG